MDYQTGRFFRGIANYSSGGNYLVSKNLQRQLYEMNKIEIAEVLKKEIDFIKSNLDSFKSQLIK